MSVVFVSPFERFMTMLGLFSTESYIGFDVLDIHEVRLHSLSCKKNILVIIKKGIKRVVKLTLLFICKTSNLWKSVHKFFYIDRFQSWLAQSEKTSVQELADMNGCQYLQI